MSTLDGRYRWLRSAVGPRLHFAGRGDAASEQPERTRLAGRASDRGLVAVATDREPLALERGEVMRHAEIAYQVFGPADAERTVLVCHALTGDAHVTQRSGTGFGQERPGWWESLIGPGRAIDTRSVHVIASNVLGGCSGSTGPASVDPATGERYGAAFPDVTVGDWVEAQRRLLDRLGVQGPIDVIGGSVGGFQALEWAIRYPERVRSAIVLASGARLNAYGLAFNAVGRSAIEGDPRFRGGWYPESDPPAAGLALARQIGHLTYRTSGSFDWRFGREVDGETGAFSVERYLDHKGAHFVRRFDANSYLRMLGAMDAYDAAGGRGSLDAALSRVRARMLLVGFSSDWLFPPGQSLELWHAAREVGVDAHARVVETEEGHDAFLLPSEELSGAVGEFLAG
ncbi:MAG: homoserine O-acetyltransferase [Planctomycetota bacterium]